MKIVIALLVGALLAFGLYFGYAKYEHDQIIQTAINYSCVDKNDCELLKDCPIKKTVIIREGNTAQVIFYDTINYIHCRITMAKSDNGKWVVLNDSD